MGGEACANVGVFQKAWLGHIVKIEKLLKMMIVTSSLWYSIVLSRLYVA